MRDVAVTKTIKPAGELHTRVSPAKTNVLDLREAKPTPPPVVKSEPTPLPMPVQKHVSVHAPKMHTQAKAQAEIPGTKTPEVRLHQIQKRLETAGTVHRSERISRFSQHQAPMAAVAPAVTARAEPSPSPEPVFNPQVAAQHEHLSRLLELSSETEKAPKRIKREPTKANFAAAALAIAVIGGYIWFHNYPHLAISTAADKAGFSASLPNFVPSSYSLNGPVSYAPGLVTLDFTSPSFKDPLKIIQQPTTWDSSSLLDNFVAQKSSNYTTVNGQGLTIYLYNNGQQAAWVNQGIWYTVVGTAHLGRDQLLKMAYSF
jgi:hypothetical protein